MHGATLGKMRVDCKLAYGDEHVSNFNVATLGKMHVDGKLAHGDAHGSNFMLQRTIEIRTVFVSVRQLAINMRFTQRRTMLPDQQLSLVYCTGNESTIDSNSPPIKP